MSYYLRTVSAFKPYEGWGATGRPTQELESYDAYNVVKHNRENEFERATLHRVFEAISACVIMIVAQFGLPAGLGKGSELRSFFQPSAVPTCPLSEVYILPYDQPTGDWSPLIVAASLGCARLVPESGDEPSPGS